MKWTSATPTKGGWYWVRWPTSRAPQIIRLYDDEGQCCSFTGMDWPTPVSEAPSAEWAGPIPEPEE